jgi:ribonuclease-3
LRHIYYRIFRLIPFNNKSEINLYYKDLQSKANFYKIGFLSKERKKELESALSIKIKRVEYFEQALTHRSYLQVLSNPIYQSNERLEFLGDSILGMIVTEYLFGQHSDIYEGELTKMRSWLVNKNTLVTCAKQLNIADFLMLSHSANKSLEGGSDSILSDALEAIIAAVYLDSGINKCRKFIINTLFPIMQDKSIMVDTNFKSILLETVQSFGKEAPKYVVINENGPDHDKEFTIGVMVDDELIGTGSGKSKKQAEQSAAQEAVDKFKK